MRDPSGITFGSAATIPRRAFVPEAVMPSIAYAVALKRSPRVVEAGDGALANDALDVLSLDFEIGASGCGALHEATAMSVAAKIDGLRTARWKQGACHAGML
jgi:hypothetical protein